MQLSIGILVTALVLYASATIAQTSFKPNTPPSASGSRLGFIFTGQKAISTGDPTKFIAIGEKLPIADLKVRFSGYGITSTVGEDCSFCAMITGPETDLQVDFDENGIFVIQITGLGKNDVDALGNRLGTPLRIVLRSSTARCEAGMDNTCKSNILGLSYSVRNKECEIHVNANGETTIPACAKIEGFIIRRDQ